MTNELKAYWDEESQSFKEYNDENDLTIHFESAKEKKDFIKKVEEAFRSLEAWEVVKEEIKNAKPVYPDRVKIWGTDTILGIINRHLQEVENADSD